MALKIALAGNPNCGKTTLFNALTGSTQYVGNWPGVTVEKKEGKLKGHKDVIIQDLPGIYSLSPYSMEEVVSRNYLVDEKPDAILNIIDGTNIERNLYLTTQLLEIGIPTVIAVNMMDLVRKNGDKIDLQALGKALGCQIVEMSALHGDGAKEAAEKALDAAKNQKGRDVYTPHVYTGAVEHALAHIEESIEGKVDKENVRWYAIKVFERDEKILEKLNLDPSLMEHLNQHIADCEKELDDDSESIITAARYDYIQTLAGKAFHRNEKREKLSTSDKIDKIVTNRILALPIFFALMWLIYDLAVGSHAWSIGTLGTEWINDVLFGALIPDAVTGALESAGAAPWLISLIVDGIIAGVGTVLGFIPLILVLFIGLSILEDSGYMARIAFIMDRIFRRFGLSGKSFIPILIGTGCGVPGIMGTRTIENEKDRRMTIILATYLPCAAKMDIVAIICATFFAGNSLVPTLMYFVGLVIIIVAGISLKKVGYFAGDPAPFVMELPAYHMPTVKGVAIHVWERVKAYAIKAGTIIFTICVVLWFLMNFSFTGFTGDVEVSILKSIGEVIAFVFRPLGWGYWQGAVASVVAELAKESAPATLAMLAGAVTEEEADVIPALQAMFGGSSVAAMSFMLFNIFNAPCLVAIATAFREQGSSKWGWITFGIQMGIGYSVSLIAYNIGMLITEGVFGLGQIVAIALILFILYALFRPAKKAGAKKEKYA
ncbi:MAG: ferrous iron transport protein B [Lachnospiraceae bacterium]|nr:ferrous iron transport protein B [Lachnospiraceae bacterium]